MCVGMLKSIFSILNAGRQAGPEHRAMSITTIPTSYGGFQTYLQDRAHGICCGTSQHLAELVEGLQISLEERGQMSTLLHGFIYCPTGPFTRGQTAGRGAPRRFINTARALSPHVNLDAKPTRGSAPPPGAGDMMGCGWVCSSDCMSLLQARSPGSKVKTYFAPLSRLTPKHLLVSHGFLTPLCPQQTCQATQL